jgi:hypothetical protein
VGFGMSIMSQLSLSCGHFKHAIRQEVIICEAHDAHSLLELLL